MRNASPFYHNQVFPFGTWHAGDVVEWDWVVSRLAVHYPPWRWTGEMQIVWDPESFGGSAAPTYYEAPAYEEIPQPEFAYASTPVSSPPGGRWSVLDIEGGLSYRWDLGIPSEADTWHTVTVNLNPVVAIPDLGLAASEPDNIVRWDIEYLGIRSSSSLVFLDEHESRRVADTSFVTQEWAAGLDTPFEVVWGTAPQAEEGIRILRDNDLDGTWDTYSWASPHTSGVWSSRDLTHFELEVGRLEFLSSYEETAEYVESSLENVELALRREDLSEKEGRVLAEFQEVDYDNVNDLSKQVESWTRYLADPEIMVDG